MGESAYAGVKAAASITPVTFFQKIDNFTDGKNIDARGNPSTIEEVCPHTCARFAKKNSSGTTNRPGNWLYNSVGATLSLSLPSPSPLLFLFYSTELSSQLSVRTRSLFLSLVVIDVMSPPNARISSYIDACMHVPLHMHERAKRVYGIFAKHRPVEEITADPRRNSPGKSKVYEGGRGGGRERERKRWGWRKGARKRKTTIE